MRQQPHTANIGTDQAVAVPGVPRTVWKTSEVVAFAVVRDIVEHGLQYGDRLPLEAEMVEQSGVSRESVREALRLLEAQGIVSIRRGPGGGPVVGKASSINLARTMTLYFQLAGATYEELLDAWRLLEPLAAELAAHNVDRGRVLDELTAHTVRFDDGGHVDVYQQHSNTLHRSVIELSANRVLSLVVGAIGDIIRTHVISRIDPFELRELIDGDHAVIARAVLAGDGSAASAAMRRAHRAPRAVLPFQLGRRSRRCHRVEVAPQRLEAVEERRRRARGGGPTTGFPRSPIRGSVLSPRTKRWYSCSSTTHVFHVANASNHGTALTSMPVRDAYRSTTSARAGRPMRSSPGTCSGRAPSTSAGSGQ